MRIKKIEPHLFEYALGEPIADARNQIERRTCVIVRVEDDDGVVGWGEAASFAGCGKLVCAVIRHLSSRLIGSDASLIGQLHEEATNATLHYGRRGLIVHALSGIDIALWDIMGKRASLPTYKLLGACRSTVGYYFNAGYYGAGDRFGLLEASIESCLNRGARGVKVKIGRFGLRDDVERIEMARRLIGKDRDLMVDANSCMRPADVCALDACMVENNVRWIEEPVPLQGVDGLAELRSRLRTPVAGYEIEGTLSGWTELINARVVDVAQPDAIWSGGISECVRIAHVAKAQNIEIVPHNFASLLSFAANAHLAAIAPTGGYLEVDSNVNPFLWCPMLSERYSVRDGSFQIPNVPGLGVEVDLSAFKPYRVDDRL